jgi:hypothetical protein
MEFPDSNNEQFHQHLREKMDALRAKAPKGLWDDIAHEINQDTSGETESSQLLDDKIRTSASLQRNAPHYLWYGIEQKLNIDNVWDKMQPRLNKMRANYRYRKVFSYFSAAVLLLLFLRSCDFSLVNDKSSTFVENNHESLQIQNNIKKEVKTARGNSVNQSALSNLSGTDIFITSNKNIEAKSFNELIAGLKPAEKFLPKVDAIFEHSKINVFENAALETHVPQDSAIAVIEIASKESSLIAEKEIAPEIASLPKLNKQKIGAYSFGLVSSLRTTIFIDDQNSRKLNRISSGNVDMVPNLTFSYAVQVGAQFGKHGMNAEFWYNNKVIQEYRYIQSGRQHSDFTEIDYLKVALLYRPELLSYGRTKIIANAGLYLSNLKGVSYRSTQHNHNIINKELNLWENGMILGLGQEHSLSKKVIIDYGFRSEIGLSGIFKSGRNNILNTKLIGFSATMGLRYRI